MEKSVVGGRAPHANSLTFGVVEREVLGKRDAEMKQKLLDIKTQAKSKREMLGMSVMNPDMSTRMKPSDVSGIGDGRLRLAASTSMIKDTGNISATRDNTVRFRDGPSMMKDVPARPDDSIFFARKKELEVSRDMLNRTQMELNNLKNRKPVRQPNILEDSVKPSVFPKLGKVAENKAPKEDPVYSFEPPAAKGLKYFDEDSTPVKAGPKAMWQGDQQAMNATRSQSDVRSARRIAQPAPKEDDELEKFVRAAQEENNKLKQDNQNLVKRYQNLQDAADATYKNQKKVVPFGGFMGAQPPVIQKVNKPPTVEQLMANNTRNWDLNDFERALAFIEAQEHDELEMISELPVGTDAYRFKVERFKEISTTRAEIQKLMQEQQLKAMKKGLDLQSRLAEVRSDNIAWTNEQRKNIIAAHMRRQLGLGNQLEYNDPNPKQASKTKKPKKKKGEYDPAEGFVIHWDYVLGIPAKQDFANYEFAVVCKSEVLRDTKEGEMVPNIQEDSKSVYSIFAQNNVIKGLEPDPETLIIWKVFMPVSEEKPNEYTEVGWTQIDPFSDAGKLQRGVWKCPLYDLPVDPNITREDVQRLKLNPIGDPWFHVRISFPAKDDYANLGVKPEETSHLAEIPNIHLRMKSWMPRADPLPPKEPEPLPVPEPTIIREPDAPKPVEPPPPVVPDINPNDRVGCIIDMKRLTIPKSNKVMKVAMICLEQGVPIEDDTTLRWIRNTIQHHPFIGSGAEALDDGTGTGAGNFRDDQLVKEGKMANLSKGDSLVVYNNTRFNLYKNFPRVWAENRKHYWLIFQLLEKRIETGAEIAKYLDPNMAEDERAEAEKKVNPFVTVGYAVFRLSTNDFKLREGLHTVNWLKPPVKIPPFEESQVPRIDSRAQLEFKILRSFYDKKDIEREYLAFKKSGKKKQDDGLANVIDPSKLDVNISNEPFIPNKKKQFQDKLFEKGYGVDFYLDQCMFVPDNVSVVKCVIRIVNARYKDVFELKGALPKLNIPNDALNPIFEYRTEYRAENFNPTSLVLITLITIDKAHNEPRVIGYAAINLFINRYTEEQPTTESDSDIVLQNGNYQIPIYAEEPLRVQPFDLSRIQKLKILPCASVLVRIRLAPVGPDFTVLSRATTRKEDWKRLGVWVPRPEYPTGVYNTQFMEIKDDERRLFPFRDSRAEQPVTEEARLLLKVAGENREFDEIQLYKWLDSKLVINKNTKLLDTKYFARYLEQAGFKFTVDAVHNVPNTNPFVVTFHLNPPGTYYQQMLDRSVTIVQPNEQIVIPDPKPEELETEEKKIAYEQMKATLVQKQKELEATRSDMLVFNAEINWKHPIGQLPRSADRIDPIC